MDKRDAEKTMELFDRLYQKHDWSDEIIIEFERRLLRLPMDAEQADAVLRNQLMSEKGFRARKPEPAHIFEALARAAGTKFMTNLSRVSGPAYEPFCPPVTGFNRELAARFDANPDDPIFGRLRAQGVSPFVATRGMRGKPESASDLADAAPQRGTA